MERVTPEELATRLANIRRGVEIIRAHLRERGINLDTVKRAEPPAHPEPEDGGPKSE